MKSGIPIYNINHLKAYKNEGILVSRFRHYANEHQHLHTAHRHTFYHLVFFTEGSGTQQIDFNTYDIKPGLIYFMIPGQVHSWDFETVPDGFIINFSTSYLSSFVLNQSYLDRFSFFSGITDQQVIELTNETQKIVTNICEAILKDGLIAPTINDDLVKTQLLRLFIEVARSLSLGEKDEATQYNHTVLKKFKHLIEQNFTTMRLPKQYAALLYITPNHLNALCNDFLGFSAGTLIRQRVILEAKRLLVNQNILIAAIAQQLNFDDQSYFIKFFKKYENITPEKFRKLNTKNHVGNKTT